MAMCSTERDGTVLGRVDVLAITRFPSANEPSSQDHEPGQQCQNDLGYLEDYKAEARATFLQLRSG